MTTPAVSPEPKKLEPKKPEPKPVLMKKAVSAKKTSAKAQKPRKQAPKRKKVAKKATRRAFPYLRVARLWAKGKTIESIARSIGRYQKSATDPLHSMRCFLHRMHTTGYKDTRGVTRKLPHRISRAAVSLARKAGKKAARG